MEAVQAHLSPPARPVTPLSGRIAKARLSQWGEAVKINDDPRFHSSTPIDKSVQLAQSMLEEIVFLSARKTSKRYELVADQQDLVVFEDKDMMSETLHS